MPSSTNKKGGKKIGRNAKKPSHVRYKSEDRREVNKLRKAEKQKKKEEKKRNRKKDVV